MRNDKALFMPRDSIVKHGGIVVLVGRHEMVLVKLDRHPHSRSYHFSKKLHVAKDPLVTDGRDPKISLEQGMKAKKEELNGGKEVVTRRPQSTTSQQRKRETQRDELGVLGRVG